MLDKSKKIVIVGAGIAGLKAASYLYAQGFTNLEILEARDRVGGRLYTVEGLNGKYDLGASWHHDLLINTLFKEEQQLGDKKGAPYVIEDDLVGLVDAEGRRLDCDPDLRLEPIREEFEDYVNEVYNPSLKKDTNLFQATINYLMDNKENLTHEQIKYMFGVARYYELWHGIDWKSISSFDAAGSHTGRNALCAGYIGIINRIGATIPLDQMLHLNTEVKEINVKYCPKTNKKYTEIEIQSGVNSSFKISKKRTIQADYVLITIPLSLLKLSLDEKGQKETGAIKFNPPFQPRLQRAIDNISYGSLGKIAFEFDKLCWSTEKSRMVYVGKNQDKLTSFIESNKKLTPELVAEMNTLTSSTAIPECESYPYFVVNLPKSLNGMPSLLFLCSEPVTVYLESLNGDVEKLFKFFEPALNSVLKSLRCKNKVVFHKNVSQNGNVGSTTPVLKNILCTSWTKDPYARGAYTAVKPGDDLEGFVEEIKKGHEDIVRFAGEACVVTGNGCTWGATTSAVRESDAIIADVAKTCRSAKL